MVISRARVTEVNKGCMDSEVTILNDKFQLVALSYGVEFVIEMSTGGSHISDKQNGKLLYALPHNTSIAGIKKGRTSAKEVDLAVNREDFIETCISLASSPCYLLQTDRRCFDWLVRTTGR
jgi:hypothetical protein